MEIRRTKRKVDNLTMDAIEASALGISYGQYIAKKYAAGVIETSARNEIFEYEMPYKHVCKMCGKEITTNHRMYCSKECYYENNRIRTLERYKRRKREQMYGQKSAEDGSTY